MSIANYTPEQLDSMRQWVENWKRVGPILEKIRHEELPRLAMRKRRRRPTNFLNWLCRRHTINFQTPVGSSNNSGSFLNREPHESTC